MGHIANFRKTLRDTLTHQTLDPSTKLLTSGTAPATIVVSGSGRDPGDVAELHKNKAS